MPILKSFNIKTLRNNNKKTPTTYKFKMMLEMKAMVQKFVYSKRLKSCHCKIPFGVWH